MTCHTAGPYRCGMTANVMIGVADRLKLRRDQMAEVERRLDARAAAQGYFQADGDYRVEILAAHSLPGVIVEIWRVTPAAAVPEELVDRPFTVRLG